MIIEIESIIKLLEGFYNVILLDLMQETLICTAMLKITLQMHGMSTDYVIQNAGQNLKDVSVTRGTCMKVD